MDFIKNYVLGVFLMLVNLPRLLLVVFLIFLPGALVGWFINLTSPSSGDGTVVGIIALLASLYVSHETRYRILIEKVCPDISFRDD